MPTTDLRLPEGRRVMLKLSGEAFGGGRLDRKSVV
jgi:hypothetical protein